MNRKSNGEGSIYKVAGGKWRAVISLGIGADGRRRRKYRTCNSRADAVAVIREMAGLASVGVTSNGIVTVGQTLDRWLSEIVSKDSAANTVSCYESIIRIHLKPRIGHFRLAKFRASHIQTMLAEMDSKVGDRTRQLAFVVLSACLQHSFRLGAIAENPCKRVARPRHTREPIRPFDAEEIRIILNQPNISGSRWYALLLLAVHTGMRQGELLGLHWEQIDLKRGVLTIDRQAVETSGIPRIDKTKTKASVRSVDISPDVVDALKSHKAILLKLGLAGGKLVFPALSGGIQGKSNFLKTCWNPIFKRFAESKPKIEIPHRGFHHLRHTFATLALGAGGVPVHVVSRIMGHASPSVTMTVYAHVLASDQAAATGAMSRILSGGCSVAAFRERQSS